MSVLEIVIDPQTIPRLENGDRLSRPEFERRYEATPEHFRAQLIEGVVYMPSPVRIRRHARPHALIVGWLTSYWAVTPGVELAIEPSLRLDMDNEPEPDAVLRIEGGGSRIDPDDYQSGAPELLVEVAASTVSLDMNDKLKAYRRNGVPEYLVWQVETGKVIWFALRAGQYVPLEPDERGIIRSQVFPGLWLDASALLGGDLAAVLTGLQQGLQSPEHDAFKQRLTP